MKKKILGTTAIYLLLFGCGFLPLTTPSQSSNRVEESRIRYYTQACQEISGMLDGKSPVSIRPTDDTNL